MSQTLLGRIKKISTYLSLVLDLLLLPPPPATTPGVFALDFLSPPTTTFPPPTLGLFFLLPPLPPPPPFFFAPAAPATPSRSAEVCPAGSSSWLSTRGMFLSPLALARAMASATMRFAFSCLHRVSTLRTGSWAFTKRTPEDAAVVVVQDAELPAEVLITLTTETAPPALETVFDCREKVIFYFKHCILPASQQNGWKQRISSYSELVPFITNYSNRTMTELHTVATKYKT